MIQLKRVHINVRRNKFYLSKFLNRDYYDEATSNIINRLLVKKATDIVIEYPYYDLDYLSTFYLFYVKKNKSYKKECYRLHAYSGKKYLGYIVLRPTKGTTKIGRTLLLPDIFLESKTYVMSSRYDVNILGECIGVEAFPWMKQETDVAVCAHVSIWSILRYFSNKYHDYSEMTMGQIASDVPETMDRRFPVVSLNKQQISNVLKQEGLCPMIQYRTDENKFFHEMVTYIESGIPFIACLTNRSHAVAVIGHGAIKYHRLEEYDQLPKDLCDNVVYNSQLIDSIVINDDSIQPYLSLYKKEKSNAFDDDIYDEWGQNVPCRIEDIDTMIVPLYNCLQYNYFSVVTYLKELLRVNKLLDDEVAKSLEFNDDKNHILSRNEKYVVRIYIISANSLKRGMAKGLSANNSIYESIITALVLPKYVWCIDFSTIEEYKKNMMSIRILADTTCCNIDDKPWLLIQSENAIMFLDENKWRIMETTTRPYDIYEHNLREVSNE